MSTIAVHISWSVIDGVDYPKHVQVVSGEVGDGGRRRGGSTGCDISEGFDS